MQTKQNCIGRIAWTLGALSAAWILSAQAGDLPADRYAQWQAYSQSLRQQPRLTVYYDFEEGAGLVLTNKAGALRGQTNLADGKLGGGVLNQAPSWAAGRWPGKKALQFDGVNDYVDCGDLAGFEPDTKTIEVWFNCAGFTGASLQAILDKAYWGGAIQYGYAINLKAHRVEAVVVGDRYTAARAGSALEARQWYHLVMVHDYDKGKVGLYLNGKLAGESSLEGFLPGLGRPLALGCHQACHCWFFKGLIDELAIYRRPLTPTEIQEHYLAGKP